MGLLAETVGNGGARLFGRSLLIPCPFSSREEKGVAAAGENLGFLGEVGPGGKSR